MAAPQSGEFAPAGGPGGSDPGSESALRRGALIIAAATCLGLFVELTVERHWTQPAQLVAWGAVMAVLVATGLVWRGDNQRHLRVAQVLAVLVVVSAAVGVGQHIAANYDAGELDAEYGEGWSSLSPSERWWLAISKTVGPSPPLAPGALAVPAALVLLAASRPPMTRHAP